MSGTLTLVPAAPDKRLGAAVLDWLPPVAVLTVLLSFGFAGITSMRSSGLTIYDTSLLTLQGTVLRITLDDGRDFRLERPVLIGPNPAPAAGESQAQLLPVAGPGRTISKTHLHLLTDGVWVTDRRSSNCSAVTTPDGMRTALQPRVPAFVSPGTTVHFGDRTFNVGHA